MGLSLKEHNAIAGLADVLYDFLPGSGSQLWTDTSPPAVTRESRCSNRLTFARLPYFFAWPLPRPLEGANGYVVFASAPGRISTRSSISNPDRRNKAIQLPWER